MKKIDSKKAMLLASAGTLALVPGLASAQGGKDDETAPADPAPQLKLNQVLVPFDAFIPPFNDPDMMGDGSQFEDELSNYESTGVIFVGEIDDHARMDFIISNIRNDKPVDVFLVMGTELAADAGDDMFPGLAPTEFRGPSGPKNHMRDGKNKPKPAPNGKKKPTRVEQEQQLEDLRVQIREFDGSGSTSPPELKKLEKEVHKLERQIMKGVPQKGEDWQGMGWKPKPKPGATPPLPAHSGEICVDIANGMEIIAAVRVTPKKPIMAQEFALGHAVQPHFTSTIVSVKLLKERLQQFENQEVYFQAAVVPVDNKRDFTEVLSDAGQVSECDRYLISNIIEEDDETDANTGSKDAGEYSDEYDESGEIALPESETSDENDGSKF
ncbi:hypothetical protein QUF50_03440 [Thiotrichales bacterium HSG1]|nr:hypothetical protein [Thiotrichales bacterium HSG1]